MSDLTVRTAGESHGPAVVALIEGLPAGLPVDIARIDADLARRQGGYGRGGRQQIERDRAEILAGVRRGRTLPGPVVLVVRNRDARLDQAEPVFRPRPGHADLAGALGFLDADVRSILERASARETAGRVAAGALAKALLAEFGAEVLAYVVRIGPAAAEVPADLADRRRRRDASDLYSPDPRADAAMKAAIDRARDAGDTLGGIIECVAAGLPPGLGRHTQWIEKLDGRLAQAVMSIQAVKGVELGLGFAAAERPGSQVHDPILYDAALGDSPGLGFVRPTNNAGGLEGGMTNGQPVVLRAAMKPISTLARPLPSVDLRTRRPEEAAFERSDVCAAPAASVIVEAVVATELAGAMVRKFGGDSLRQMKAAYEAWRRAAQDLS
ncbi:MAG: chorismate synthase [Planctomycetes bacterium]|nr:chorismate synthase [Planctomycetota bacterium]